MKHVYFDNSATTKPDESVLRSLYEVLERFYGNPSSIHHLGVQADQLMKKAAQVIGNAMQVEPAEVVFTSGGTESNNLAIKGIAFGYQQRGKHIITTEIEHPSVHEVCHDLAERFGFEITYLPVDRNGRVNPQDVQDALRKDTILVSIMHVNNELGSIQPIEEIGELLKAYPNIYFHVDQVQGFGKVQLNIKQARIDLLSISGHKLHAPKGTGLLYINKRIREMYPLFHGGAQQSKLRPGTENVPGIVALAKALRLAQEGYTEHILHLGRLQRQLVEGLREIKGVHINSPEQFSAPHILNVSFKGLKPEVMVHALEEKGIFVSTRSACSSKAVEPSRIIYATTKDRELSSSAIRISFAPTNTAEEVTYFLEVIKDILPKYQQIMKVK